MTGYVAEQIDIEAAFHSVWDTLDPAIAVAHENESFDPTNLTEFVRLSIRNADGRQMTIGGGSSKYRYRGVLMIQIFVLEGIGAGRANQIVDIISPIFRSNIISNIHFDVPAVTRMGNVRGWYQINLDTGFYRED